MIVHVYIRRLRRLLYRVSDWYSCFGRRVKCLVQILYQIGRVFQAHGQSDQSFGDACCLQCGGIHAVMRGAGRVDHQGLGVADIGQVRDQFQSFDETLPGRPAAFHAEAEHGADALR